MVVVYLVVPLTLYRKCSDDIIKRVLICNSFVAAVVAFGPNLRNQLATYLKRSNNTRETFQLNFFLKDF